jgi:zinc transporter 9
MSPAAAAIAADPHAHHHQHIAADAAGPFAAAADGSTQALQTMLLVCLGMFSGAFVAGLSFVQMTRKTLDLVNVLGVGLLLGTGLGVIIPEGMRELYAASSDPHHPPELVVGVALTLGFLTMVVVDHLACCGGGSAHGHSHHDEPPAEESLSPLPQPKTPARVTTPVAPQHVHHREDDDDDDLELQRAATKRRRATVTLGLLIHNAADGLAMGASKASRSEWTSAQMLVFSAIMIHHVPAAFGFATFLRSSGLDESQVRERVLVFASVGPVVALCAFLLLHNGFIGAFSLPKEAVGACLLFSGGTFLYVPPCTPSRRRAAAGSCPPDKSRFSAWEPACRCSCP